MKQEEELTYSWNFPQLNRRLLRSVSLSFWGLMIVWELSYD